MFWQHVNFCNVFWVNLLQSFTHQFLCHTAQLTWVFWKHRYKSTGKGTTCSALLASIAQEYRTWGRQDAKHKLYMQPMHPWHCQRVLCTGMTELMLPHHKRFTEHVMQGQSTGVWWVQNCQISHAQRSAQCEQHNSETKWTTAILPSDTDSL